MLRESIIRPNLSAFSHSPCCLEAQLLIYTTYSVGSQSKGGINPSVGHLVTNSTLNRDPRDSFE